MIGLAVTVLAANAALFLERRSQLKQTLAGIVEAAGGASAAANDAGGKEARP